MKEIDRLEPKAFTRFCMSIGAVPSSYIAGLTIEEQLLWFCSYLEKEVIPAVNNNAEAVTELQNLYVQLKQYVDDYFENLDVQEEINNKLDEMAESGQLTDIIAQYLQLAGVLAYDTKAQMKAATNLVEGSITKTLGNLAYNDGQGAFFKVRQVQNTDVIDDENIIALSDPDLVAEKIQYSSGYDIQQQIDNISEKLNNEVETKLTLCKNAYYNNYNIVGNKYGLSYEKITNNSNPFNIQGICCNPKNGEIYGVNSSSIFKLTEGNPSIKTILYNIDFGHGGDCCIYNNNIFVSDSQYNKIHKVDLSNGNDIIYSISNSSIINEETEGTPKIGGVAIKNSNEIYIAVIDEGEDNTQLLEGATIRIYTYNLINESIEKIFEMNTNIVYLQGMTVDNDNFYIVGNKPLSNSDYTGNKLNVINKYSKELIDTLEDSNAIEWEGIDYYCKDGQEGLLTTLGSYGIESHYGVYSFYGNCTRVLEDSGTNPNYNKYITISRGGLMNVRFEINDTITGNQTITYSNFLKEFVNNVKSGASYLGYGNGNSRSEIILFQY